MGWTHPVLLIFHFKNIFRLQASNNLPYEKVGNREPVCIADEVPFEIPEGWEWVRLGQIVFNHGQKKPETDFCYIDIGSIDNKNQRLNADETILLAANAPSRARKIVEYNDIIYSTVRPYLHNMCIIDREFSLMPIASTGFAVLACHAELFNEFLFYYMMAPDFDSYANDTDNAKGVAYPAINDERLYRALIPLPPVAEQYRIVEKIRALIPYIKKYDQVEIFLTKMNELFPDQLKKSILQLAVQGKLVPQEPDDEPASVLLERIRAEKEQLINEGKIKRDKHESVIYRRDNSHYEKLDGIERCIDDEIPFEIPEGWEWVRLHSLVSKEIKRGKSPKYSTQKGIQVFAQKCNVKTGGIDMTLAKYLDPSTFAKYPQEEYLQDYDIIINSTGNGTLGRIGIFQDADRIDDSIIVPDSHVTTVRMLPGLNKGYLLYVLKYYQPYLEKQGTGSTNQTELRPSIIGELLIPVSSEAEQYRIVRKIDTALSILKGL